MIATIKENQNTASLKPTHSPEGHPGFPNKKIGILMVNLGTPDDPSTSSVRRYLAQFLSDPRVIELNPFLWKIILHGFILRTRPQKSAANYAKIWDYEQGDSPLRIITKNQADKLQTLLDDQLNDVDDNDNDNDEVKVYWAMRYGNPSIESVMAQMVKDHCQKIVLLPMYPQYSATTSASVSDDFFRCYQKLRWQPAARVVPPFHDDTGYIQALKIGLDRHLNALDWKPEKILLSFHGLPKRYFMAGDPYHCHCAKTARLLREACGFAEADMPLVFQSLFGREEWLKPYAEPYIIDLAKSGVKRIAVMTPGFMADCIETLEEVELGFHEIFEEHGGEKFTFVPCLNDNPEAVDLLSQIALREMQGWLEMK